MYSRHRSQVTETQFFIIKQSDPCPKSYPTAMISKFTDTVSC
jgi:hypothetical protein